MRAPTDVGRTTGPVSEHFEVSPHRGPVQRALLGLEILGVDERLGTRRSELGVRELGIFEEPVRYREAGVGRSVGVALAARVLVCEAAPAHVVGPAQHRGRDRGNSASPSTPRP